MRIYVLSPPYHKRVKSWEVKFGNTSLVFAPHVYNNPENIVFLLYFFFVYWQQLKVEKFVKWLELWGDLFLLETVAASPGSEVASRQ